MIAIAYFFLNFQVPPIDYLRQVTLELGGSTSTVTSAEGQSQQAANTSGRSTVATLIKRFNEVIKFNKKYQLSNRKILLKQHNFQEVNKAFFPF